MTMEIEKITIPIFRRLRKISKSEVERRHVYLPVCPHGTTQLPRDGFSCI